MIDFTNIKDYAIERPNVWTCLGSPEEFDALTDQFKDQILFLNEKASNFLYKYFEASEFHTGPVWEPFQKNNFKYQEKISVGADYKEIKKWLYNKGIPFSKWVYVLPNYGQRPLTMTWKMVIKSCESLFFADDIVIFDKSNQWCLSYWHEDEIFFGKVHIVDPEIGYKKVEQMNEWESYKHPLKNQ